MDADSFTDLALRVLAGNAGADERRALEAEIAAQADRREEFRQLEAVHDLLRTSAPMADALSADGPELPAWRMNELRTAVRQHFGPATDQKSARFPGWMAVLRWLGAGGGAVALAMLAMFVVFSDHTVEIGLYQTGLMRGGETALTPQDVPAARLVTFDEDAAFDQWQSRPLAWYEHARVWVDNEHDLLHIVRRAHGGVITETEPLAPTLDGQREQVQQAVEALKK